MDVRTSQPEQLVFILVTPFNIIASPMRCVCVCALVFFYLSNKQVIAIAPANVQRLLCSSNEIRRSRRLRIMAIKRKPR